MRLAPGAHAHPQHSKLDILSFLNHSYLNFHASQTDQNIEILAYGAVTFSIFTFLVEENFVYLTHGVVPN